MLQWQMKTREKRDLLVLNSQSYENFLMSKLRGFQKSCTFKKSNVFLPSIEKMSSLRFSK